MSSWIVVGIVLPLIIGMIGEIFKKLALPGKMPATGWPGWQGVYFVTFPAHSILAGCVAGIFMFLTDVNWPKDVFGTSAGAAVLAGAFSGGVAMIGYDVIIKTIKNALCLISVRKNSEEE